MREVLRAGESAEIPQVGVSVIMALDAIHAPRYIFLTIGLRSRALSQFDLAP